MITFKTIKRGFLIFSWALYDLADQFFAVNVVSLYFVRWVTLEKKAPEIFYSVSFSLSLLLVAILSPILGAVSDLTGRLRVFLVSLTLLSIVFTMLLGIVRDLFTGLLFFAVANFGCQLAIVFYNAQMINIAPHNKIGFVSGLGRMLGYGGAALALFFINPITLNGGYQSVFIPTGILFLIFALPCMVFVKDRCHNSGMKPIYFFKKNELSAVFSRLKASALNTLKTPGLQDFLKATFFSFAPVNIVILFMSTYATLVFALNETQIINLIAFAAFFAMAGSMVSGFLSDSIGYKRSLVIIFIIWMICFLLGGLARDSRLYWVIGALVGFALGSIWVVYRALAIKLVPKENVGEMFGLFNLVGYASAIMGTLFWGISLLFLSPLGETGYRIALLSLILFKSLGFIFLLRL